MKKENTILILAAFFISTFSIYYTVCDVFTDSWIAFDFLGDIICYITFAISAICIIKKATRKYLQTKRKYYLASVPILVVAFIITFYIHYSDYQSNKESNILFQASYSEDFNGISIDLKKDNTFLINDFAGIGGHYFRGKYKVENNYINLKMDRSYPEGKNIADRLMIEGDSIYYLVDKYGTYNYSYTMKITKNRIIN